MAHVEGSPAGSGSSASRPGKGAGRPARAGRSGRPGRPSKDEAQDTRALLIDAATRLFARHGYAGTSTRAIAREVGLSESVLYAHFPNKQAIYEAAYSQGGPAAVTAVIDTLAERDLDPPAYARAFATELLARWDTDRARRLTSLTGHDGLVHDPALLEDIERALARLTEVFTTWAEQGAIAPGEAEPRDLAYVLLAPIAHARQLWLHDSATAEQLRTGRERIVRHGDFVAGVLGR